MHTRSARRGSDVNHSGMPTDIREMYIYMCINIYTYGERCTHICSYISTYAHTHRKYANVNMCLYICVYIYMHVYVYTRLC